MKKVQSPNDELPGNGLGHDPNCPTMRAGEPAPRSCQSCPAPEDRMAERIRRRIECWKTKYNPDRVSAILADKAESMREHHEAQTQVLCQVEKSVAEVTDAAGVPPMIRFWYTDFGREVYRIWRKIPSSCRETECGFAIRKWQVRGLDPAILDRVKGSVVKLLDSLDMPRVE